MFWLTTSQEDALPPPEGPASGPAGQLRCPTATWGAFYFKTNPLPASIPALVNGCSRWEDGLDRFQLAATHCRSGLPIGRVRFAELEVGRLQSAAPEVTLGNQEITLEIVRDSDARSPGGEGNLACPSEGSTTIDEVNCFDPEEVLISDPPDVVTIAPSRDSETIRWFIPPTRRDNLPSLYSCNTAGAEWGTCLLNRDWGVKAYLRSLLSKLAF